MIVYVECINQFTNTGSKLLYNIPMFVPLKAYDYYLGYIIKREVHGPGIWSDVCYPKENFKLLGEQIPIKGLW